MFLLAAAIILATILVFQGVKIFNYIDHMMGIMEMIPGPTPYPFVGNLFQFGLKPDEYPKKILQYCRKYDFRGFRSLVFLQYHIILSDPAEIQNMLSSSSLLYKEHLYSFLRPWLGDGVLTSSGARWLKHHKLYEPAFSRSAIEGNLHVVRKTGKKFVQKLAEQTDVFDAQELVGKCTLDIVCENATGIASNFLDNEPSDLHSSFKDLCDVIKERTFSIVKRFDTLFKFTPYYMKQRRALGQLRNEINRITLQRRRQLADGAAKQSFLDMLLAAKIDGRALNENELFEELSTYIFTGHDPVSSAISFTLYTLSRHMNVQQKVYEEQIRILGNHLGQGDDQIGCEKLEEMRYLEMVIRETLRLYPSVPIIARTNRKSIDINGTKVTKRTTVMMCLIAMGYNERYYDEPCVFRPERFERVAREGTLDAFKSVPFSAGPRRCIAEKYAMYQLQALISLVVRNFEILPPVDGLPPGINDHSQLNCQPQSEFDPVLNIRVTLKSENGIQIRLRKRETK